MAGYVRSVGHLGVAWAYSAGTGVGSLDALQRQETWAQFAGFDGFSVLSVNPWQAREKSDVIIRLIEQLGHNPDHVCGIRVSESEINVDMIDFDDPNWPATTARHVDLKLPPDVLSGLGQPSPASLTVSERAIATGKEMPPNAVRKFYGQ